MVIAPCHHGVWGRAASFSWVEVVRVEPIALPRINFPARYGNIADGPPIRPWLDDNKKGVRFTFNK